MQVYARVAIGGFIIIDDFHLVGCRSAVHVFRSKHGITAPLLPMVTSYLACPQSDHRAALLAEDLAGRVAQARVPGFVSFQGELRVNPLLSQNVYWVKGGKEVEPAAPAMRSAAVDANGEAREA